MATPTPTNAIWHFRINLSRAGQKAMITTYLRNNGSPGSTDYFDFCSSILNGAVGVGQVYSLARDLLHPDWFLDSMTLQAISPTRLVPFGYVPTGAPLPGNRFGTALPINTACTIQRVTADGTRHGQGSLHPPFGNTGDTLDQVSWTATFRNSVDAFALKMVSVFVGTNPVDQLQPVIWSSGAGNPAIDFRVAATTSSLRTMRRRTLGRGI